ncbi:hypothetical protein ANCDUO_22936 [Ancylostoma duodenale]|uniref:Uncharacterized protein n=1 Tax=Ancylostoma duodenale TaxID=51022 RepID=A0A0C2BT07_9BILA|nr:hypothetical protein ANCDUO_22936 [Ancylostoma duodenale]
MVDKDTELMEASTSEPQGATKIKVSFGVKRAAPSKLRQSSSAVVDVQFDSDEERKHEEDARRNKKRKLTLLEDGSVLDDDDKKKKTAIIPVVKECDWRVARLLSLKKECKLTDEDRAKLAILMENQPFTSLPGSSLSSDAIIVDEERKETEDADYGAVSNLNT